MASLLKIFPLPTVWCRRWEIFHIQLVGGDYDTLPRDHELALARSLRREHGLVKKKDLRAGEKVHAQLLTRYWGLSFDA